MFKAGDTVKIKENCSGTHCGEIYTLKKFDGLLWAGKEKSTDSKGCSCQNNWELVKKETKMFKVGDKVRCIEGPQTHDGADKRGCGWTLGYEFIVGKIVGDIYWPKVGNGVWGDNLELAEKNISEEKNTPEKMEAKKKAVDFYTACGKNK